jgi:hypothetical protein
MNIYKYIAPIIFTLTRVEIFETHWILGFWVDCFEELKPVGLEILFSVSFLKEKHVNLVLSHIIDGFWDPCPIFLPTNPNYGIWTLYDMS